MPVQAVVTNAACSIIYGYFEIAAKEGDAAGLKGMVMG
jgi:protein transport protein SEC61 subunit alpha